MQLFQWWLYEVYGMHCSVCVFSQCLRGFSPGTSASSKLQIPAGDELASLNRLLFVSQQSVQRHYRASTMIPILNAHALLTTCECDVKFVTLARWCFGTGQKCRPAIRKRGFKVDAKHCTFELYYWTVKRFFYEFTENAQYPEIWSTASLYSPVWRVVFLKSQKNNEEETQRPHFSSDRSRSTGSSHHVAKRILHLQTNNDMKALNPRDPEALDLKLRRFRSKG